MTWADRLLRLTSGDRTGEVVEHLRGMHHRSSDQAHRLAAAAAQAPTAGAENELRSLAAAHQGELTPRLAEALTQRGAAPAPAMPAAALNGAARNHWARLVAALDACRGARAELSRVTPRLVDADPSLASLLAAVDRGYVGESLALRALIARADPQALN